MGGFIRGMSHMGKRQPSLAEGKPHIAPVPPSRYAYIHYCCRCDACRRSNADDAAAMRLRRASSPKDVNGHVVGKPVNPSTYVNWGCRCDGCAATYATKNRRSKERRKARRARERS